MACTDAHGGALIRHGRRRLHIQVMGRSVVALDGMVMMDRADVAAAVVVAVAVARAIAIAAPRPDRQRRERRMSSAHATRSKPSRCFSVEQMWRQQDQRKSMPAGQRGRTGF